MASEVDWSFDGRWPYAARFFDSADGRLAYVDEGGTDAEPVVLLHGNPTWGYLYRRVIPPLVAGGRRAIAVDHLGFGCSDKPNRAELYRVPAHAARLEELLESLELQSATLVVHDWSGPIGLRWAVRHPERVARLLILNTFAPRLPGPMGGCSATPAVRAPGLGSLLARRRDVLTEQFLFKAGLENEEGLVRAFQSKSVRVVWGMKDVLFGAEVLSLWQELLPDARATRLDEAGHFVQEDAPEEVTAALLELATEPAPGRATRLRRSSELSS